MGNHWMKRRVRGWFGAGLSALGTLTLVMATVSPAAATPSITVTPHDNLTDGLTVMVSGSGFSPPAQLPFAIVLECNNDPTMPTVNVQGQQVPVGCTNPLNALFNFDNTGSLPPTAFVVHKGTVGPPTAGTDSAGHDAATDAALFPCPPTSAQVAKGIGCDIILADVTQVRATQPITFVGSGGTTTTTNGGTTSTTGGTTTTTAKATTTTSSSTSTSTTTKPTTTTTAQATTTTTTKPGPSVAVDPNTDLVDAQSVNVSGSGYSAGPGAILQCNNDPSQPTIAALGNNLPVSCTDPLSKLINFDGSGNLASTPFTVKAGTTGPPAQGNDSAGHDAATDAANFPCPPTQAQQAAGVSCVIALGDASGHQATENVAFQGQSSSSTTTSTPGSGSTTTTSGSVSLQASPGTVNPGDTVTLTGSNLPANGTFTVEFASTPVTLGTVTSNAQGAFLTMVTIPSDAAVGTHHISVLTANGTALATVAITVVAPGTATTATTAATQVLGTTTTSTPLAFTGLDARTLMVIGFGFVIVGLVTLADSRRGRPAGAKSSSR